MAGKRHKRAASLEVHAFGSRDPLARLPPSDQVSYLRCYLHDLGAAWVLEEPYYFDRDYLAAFKAFYGESAAGYANVCRRLTFFKAVPDCATREQFGALFRTAVGGSEGGTRALEEAFVGFTVLRPIPKTPLGRTVLSWYPDDRPNATPRVVAPCRDYEVHIAGLQLRVTGLAWQQQDLAVAACATVGLWTMLQSSAFRDRLALPTTAGITEAGHRTASFGERVFPTGGLYNHHMLEAIKEHGLAPILLEGDLTDGRPTFSMARFSTTCASLLRSGFPVLLLGARGDEGHVMCAVGFRPRASPLLETGTFREEDERLAHLYVHDDALGANVRFAIVEGPLGEATLVPDAPPARYGARPVPDPTHGVTEFTPRQLAIAVVPELRVSPDTLHATGLELAKDVSTAMAGTGRDLPGVQFGLQLVRLSVYLRDVLSRVVAIAPALQRARLSLVERTPPLSLYVAVVRLSVSGIPLVDVLYDTTDARRGLDAFAHVVFDKNMGWLLKQLSAVGTLGDRVRAY